MLYMKTFLLQMLSCTVFFCVFWNSVNSLAQTSTPAASTLASLSVDVPKAQQGDIAAQLRLGKAYNEGEVVNGTILVRRNYAQALKWFQAASTQGSMEATAWLGSLYLMGHGDVQDLSRASNLILSAAASGDPVGLRFAGLMHETGRGVTRSYPQAVAYYRQAAAKNDANAFDRLGMLYLRGLGVKRRPGKAFALFTQGAASGDSWAELNLGEMYYGGHVPQVQATASSPGNFNSSGHAVTALQKADPDYASALRFFGQSAAQGNRVAAYRLGQMYEAGLGVSQDYNRAYQYYQQSARRQYGPAWVALGQAEEMGRGTPLNLPYAYAAYNLAVEQNDPTAPSLLESLTRRLNPTQLQQAQIALEHYKRRGARAANSD